MPTTYEYFADLNDKQILAALIRIDKNMEGLAKRGSTSFKGIEQSANVSGVKIGAVAGIVGALTTEFINLGRQAVDTLINIGQQSVNTALEFDTLRARLLGIFDGSQEAADAAFGFIQDRSRQLGIDLGELAGAFLPKTESLAQFERAAKIATALARSDPEQGAIGARIALIEALSGTFTSLQRRFEIPKEDIDRLKEAFDTDGIEGFLTALEKTLAASGKSFDDLSNTAQTSISKVQESLRQGLGQVGVPITEELKEQFDDLGAVLNDRDTDLAQIAERFGEVLANVVAFVGSGLVDFLENLDKEQVMGLLDNFNGIVESAQQLVEIFSLLDLPQQLLDNVSNLTKGLDQALKTAVQLSLLAKAEAARIDAEEVATRAQLPTGANALLGAATGAAGAALTAGIPGVSGAATDALAKQQAQIVKNLLPAQQRAAVNAAGEEAYNNVLLEGLEILDRSQQEETELAQRREERASRAAAASESAADAILAEAAAQREAEQATSEYADALAKVNEKQAEFETELEQRGSDITLDTYRKRLDALEDFANKRVEIARKNVQKIEDIERDFDRDIEDQDRDRQRALIEQSKEEAQDKLGIEENYQRQLRDIRQRFSFDLEEAAKKRDAVTFLRLQRQQQEEIQSAQTTRNDDLQDATTTGEQKREELRQQQQYEAEDARIAYELKLEDQRIAQARETEEVRIAEELKLAEINTWQQRQYEDLASWAQLKQEQLNQSLAAELEIIRTYEQAKTAVVAEETAARAALFAAQQETRIANRAATILPGMGRTQRRQFGGPVYPGQSYFVGERGPELFSPSQAGVISPSGPGIMQNLGSTSNVSNTLNAQRTLNNNMNLLDPNSLDSLLASKVETIMTRLLARL